MKKTFQLKPLPSEAASDLIITRYAAQAAGEVQKNISGFTILKRSVDARGRQPWIIVTIELFIREHYQPKQLIHIILKDVSKTTEKVIIVGASKAGLL